MHTYIYIYIYRERERTTIYIYITENGYYFRYIPLGSRGTPRVLMGSLKHIYVRVFGSSFKFSAWLRYTRASWLQRLGWPGGEVPLQTGVDALGSTKGIV